MTYPETVKLSDVDRLRAGMLDDDPEMQATVRSALEQGGALACRDGDWDRLCTKLEASVADDTRLTNQLRIRRRAVLSGKAADRTRRRFTLPQMAAAAVASVALTLSVVLLLGERPSGTGPTVSNAVDIASTDLANAFVSNVVDIDLDLTDNVDFYAWMGGQTHSIIEPRGKGT